MKDIRQQSRQELIAMSSVTMMLFVKTDDLGTFNACQCDIKVCLIALELTPMDIRVANKQLGGAARNYRVSRLVWTHATQDSSSLNTRSTTRRRKEFGETCIYSVDDSDRQESESFLYESGGSSSYTNPDSAV